jgi:hypothetical protein
VGVFLALLELIREKKVLVQQQEVNDELEIVEAPEEHRRTYAHASLHLADEAAPADETPAPAGPAPETAAPAEAEGPPADEPADHPAGA